MNRSEAIGLGVAALGHAAVFGLLVLGWRSQDTDEMLNATRAIDVSLVDDVALESAGPPAIEPPAESVAPETGLPEDAPPPDETVAVPDPAPPVPEPRPVPPPKPVDLPKPKPPRPAAAAAQQNQRKPLKPPTDTTAKSATKKPASVKSTGTDVTAKAPRPRGSRLGEDFRKGLTTTPSTSTATTPRTTNVGATAVASLGDAIRRQVQPCADKVPNPGPGANLIRSKIRIQMRPDGTLAARPELRGQSGVDATNQRYARRVAELAMSAFIQCAPYELPGDLYEGGWKDIILNYSLPG